MPRSTVSARRRARAAALVAFAAAGLIACEPTSAPRASFPVTFIARADEPLAGVKIRIDGDRALGTTGPDGVLRATLSGPEGAPVPFQVTCPEGHRPPREMPVLTLRRFVGLDPASAARGIQVTIECSPVQRMAALVVRAGEPGLPVLARGREVARTGPDGVAHAVLALPPETTFRVVLDTSARPDLHPESPATTLALGDADDIFIVDQAFAAPVPVVVAAAPPVKRPPRKRPHKPPAVAPPAAPPPEILVPEPLR